MKALEGATLARFNFTTIRLYPHTKAVQTSIETISAKSCPNTLRALNATYNGRNIFEVANIAFSKRTCRDRFGISEYEFSILKLEHRKTKSNRHDLLYFGEIPTEQKTKRRYKPTSYQMPLKKANAPNCTRCSLIRRASPTRPPIFPRSRLQSVTLEGEWGSTTCETQPGSRFLTRYMKFNSKMLSWERQTTFFIDSRCESAEFTLYEEGNFLKSLTSTFRGSTAYVITATVARMTPHSEYIKDILNTVRDNQCGMDNSWAVGVEQDITPSGGCNIYSISVPDTTYDLAKYDKTENGDKELYFGQKRTDERKINSPSLRPTSFQIPLVQCSAFRFRFKPPTNPPSSAAPTMFPVSLFNPYVSLPTLNIVEKPTPKRRGTRASTTKKQTMRVFTEDAQGSYSGARSVRTALLPFVLVPSTLWCLYWNK